MKYFPWSRSLMGFCSPSNKMESLPAWFGFANATAIHGSKHFGFVERKHDFIPWIMMNLVYVNGSTDFEGNLKVDQKTGMLVVISIRVHFPIVSPLTDAQCLTSQHLDRGTSLKWKSYPNTKCAAALRANYPVFKELQHDSSLQQSSPQEGRACVLFIDWQYYAREPLVCSRSTND